MSENLAETGILVEEDDLTHILLEPEDPSESKEAALKAKDQLQYEECVERLGLIEAEAK